MTKENEAMEKRNEFMEMIKADDALQKGLAGVKIMKKKITILALAMSILFSLSGCTGSEKESAGETDDRILKEIETANQTGNLMENDDIVAFQYTFYFEDGTIESWYTYKDEQLYASENEGDVFISADGMMYGFDSNEDLPFVYLLVGVDPQEIADEMEVLSGYSYVEDEIVVSSTEEDGILYLETATSINEGTKEDLSYYGFEVKDGDSLIHRYEVVPASKEISGYTVFLKTADDEEYLISEMKRVAAPEKYQPDEQLVDQIFNEDLRTVTVIADPGTENEKTYSCSVGKGCAVYTQHSDSYSTFYTDVDCTELYKGGDADLNADSILYTKAEETDKAQTEETDQTETGGGEYEYPSEDAEPVLWESPLGYSMKYDPTVFTLDDTGESEIFTYNTAEKLDAPVYISVMSYPDMDAQTLAEGLVLQSGIDGVEVQDSYFGAVSVETKLVYIEKEVDGVKQIQIFYAIPVGEGSLLVEMGTYAGVPERVDWQFEEMVGTFMLT